MLPYKIDIVGERESGRWLYSTEGFATILAVKSGPTYRVDDPSSLNRLLGLNAGSSTGD
jgi:hypothetical protein